MDQYCRVLRSCLPDKIECMFDQSFQPYCWHPYTKFAAEIVPIAFEWGFLGKGEQDITEPIDAG